MHRIGPTASWLICMMPVMVPPRVRVCDTTNAGRDGTTRRTSSLFRSSGAAGDVSGLSSPYLDHFGSSPFQTGWLPDASLSHAASIPVARATNGGDATQPSGPERSARQFGSLLSWWRSALVRSESVRACEAVEHIWDMLLSMLKRWMLPSCARSSLYWRDSVFFRVFVLASVPSSNLFPVPALPSSPHSWHNL